MSLLLRDELRVVLLRDQLRLVRMAGKLTLKGRVYEVLDKMTVAFEADAETPWGSALDKLEKILATSAIKPEVASVVVGNHFFRYALVDVDPALQKTAEQVAFVQHRFGQLYGADAEGWDFRLDREYPGAPFFVSAVDGRLIAALRDVFQRVDIRLQSIQPCLMKAYNRCQPELKNGNSWFVIFEHGSLCLAMLKDGHLNAVRTIKAGDDWLENLPQTLERESFLAELDCDPEQVLLWSAESTQFAVPKNGRWKMSKIQPAIPAGLQGQFDEQYALAMIG